MAIVFHNRIPRTDIGLGLVVVEGIQVAPASASLVTRLESVIAQRRQPLTPDEEARRSAGRDMLRNGAYKPTGRGKPASEYLLRAALDGDFPRINGPVDANNLVSLEHCVPISLWDLDLAQSAEFEFRLGAATESYVFNSAGQILSLSDLVCGCACHGPGTTTPIVTPIKDSLATKLTERTSRVAGCIYFPLQDGAAQRLAHSVTDFLGWLSTCGPSPRASSGVCQPGQSITL